MAKTADVYFVTEPFSVTEEGFDLAHNAVAESVFSLGNEYMGVRGYAEEGVSAPTLQGSYFNGIYEYALSDTPIHYKGIVQRTHFMINSVDWLRAEIRVGEEQLDTAKSIISDYRRTLDFKSGVLTRSFVWTTKSGRISLRFERFLDMTYCRRGYQRMILLPLDGVVEIKVTLLADGDVLHWGNHCYWNPADASAQDGLCVIAETPTTNQRLVCVQHIDTDAACVDVNAGGLRASRTYSVRKDKGESAVITRFTVNSAIKRIERSRDEDRFDALDELDKSVKRGYNGALDAAKSYWRTFWERSDIEIGGDPDNQQGIRFCIFQLQQTYHGVDAANNIGAKGLTGEAYSGHTFWDTETYCLPYYLFNNPGAAKNLLLYRYSKLEQAKARAKMLDCEGACYPIATLDGNEACNLWQHASLQFQPSTGVVYGVWHYERVSGDAGFVKDYGFEMVTEIARFLLSRGQWNAAHTKFGYYGVMGPDEFQLMVNHNAYTNYMAKRSFEYLIELTKRYPDRAAELGITENFIASVKECCDAMYLPYDAGRKLYEQHEGYFDLPHIDVYAIPVTEFPLYDHWSYDRIYRNDMIKQPDVLMFLFLYNSAFDPETKRANYEFYEPRTIHESSLSPSVHSILAAELGKSKDAIDFFGYATRMDLDDYNRNACQGLHTTSIAAAWVNIVYGFGGLRSDGTEISLAPSLPLKWTNYSFRIAVHGRALKISVDRSTVLIESGDAGVTELLIYGRRVRIEAHFETELKL